MKKGSAFINYTQVKKIWLQKDQKQKCKKKEYFEIIQYY